MNAIDCGDPFCGAPPCADCTDDLSAARGITKGLIWGGAIWLAIAVIVLVAVLS